MSFYSSYFGLSTRSLTYYVTIYQYSQYSFLFRPITLSSTIPSHNPRQRLPYQSLPRKIHIWTHFNLLRSILLSFYPTVTGVSRHFQYSLHLYVYSLISVCLPCRFGPRSFGHPQLWIQLWTFYLYLIDEPTSSFHNFRFTRHKPFSYIQCFPSLF